MNVILGDQYASIANSYNSDKAYSNYPVLNISFEAAQLYCNWLTENDKSKNYKYRLPTKEEWVYAAKGGIEQCLYSWGGPYLKGKKGQFLCNYKCNDEELQSTLTNNSQGSITMPIKSFTPNIYGLYNVCGNVAEMIEERGIAMGGSWNNTGYEVRVESQQAYKDANPIIGFRPVRVLKK